MSERIILCGFARAAQGVLEQLLKNYSADDIFVYTTDDTRNADFLAYLADQQIQHTTTNINDCLDAVQQFHPTYILSIYYPYIITDEILTACEGRAMNLHPSLLPKYRGCFSAPWVIINGEETTGVSYHYMVTGVDKGNLLVQKTLPITADDTAATLYNKLIDLGIETFREAFEKLRHRDEGMAQTGEGNWYKREVPFGGKINLSWGREKIYRFIRAMHFPPYKGAVLEYNGTEQEFLTEKEFDAFIQEQDIQSV